VIAAMRTLFSLTAAVVLAAVVAVLAMAAWRGTSVAQEITHAPPEAIVIGVDLSLSNPMIKDRAFSEKVAAWVHPRIAKLGPKSLVILRTFGSYDGSENQLKLDQTIAAKRNLAPDVAFLVSGVIAGIPTLIRNGQVKAQTETNILAFLENMSKIVDCKAMPTTVILASDGIEDSEFANLSRRNDASGGPALPMPLSALFPGCQRLVILGLGQGTRSPAKTQFLQGEWGTYARKAGFREFVGLNDW
jgi:hypothetical protein